MPGYIGTARVNAGEMEMGVSSARASTDLDSPGCT